MEFLVPCAEPPQAESEESDRCDEPGCGMLLSDGVCAVHATAPTPKPAVTTRDGGHTTGILEFPWGSVPVGAGELIIGRSDESSIGFEADAYPNVSRRHAVLWHDGRSLRVRDEDSLNGTYVNDRPVSSTDGARVSDGDVIRFGAHLRATVRNRPEQP
ncbi:FHA domain-containing protein [Amycolatopsis sp. Hca4]|uniref:FHA domain-containing protein n=1 Tax=Amycolatopsis sp. Hca4 TaxID=2742131 RepID=UPI0015925091|nr:FHA domain-containing protein [Amycolatopsis sp. Hca4]QKV74892.1 FHA domain-containing protein [Amycolatopsis sp. Hca4]